MASVVAIIGAVAGTVGTINILKTWVAELLDFLKKYQDVGQTLQNLNLSLVAHETALVLWMKLWKLELPTTQRFQRELWGKEALVAIQEHFVAISSALENTRTELANVLKDSFGKQLGIQIQLGSTAVADYRAQATLAKKQLSTRQIISFIRDNGPSIDERLSSVAQWIVSMRELSVNAYEAKHRSAVARVLTKEQLELARTSTLLQMALESRYASIGLYRSYKRLVELNDIKVRLDQRLSFLQWAPLWARLCVNFGALMRNFS